MSPRSYTHPLLVLAIAFAMLPHAPSAQADDVGALGHCIIDIDTGSNGTTLPQGAVDPDWNIVAGPQTGPAIVFEAVPGSYVNAPPAMWLAPDTSGNHPVGWYTFQHTFVVPAGTAPSLSLVVAVDNNVDVVLNGNLVGQVTGGSTNNFKVLHPMSTSTGFVVGTNVLELHVQNLNPSSPMGVIMRGDVTLCEPQCNEDPSVIAAEAYDVGISSILGGLTVNQVSASLGNPDSNTVLAQSHSHGTPPISVQARELSSRADAYTAGSQASANIADLKLVIGTAPPVTIYADALRAEANAQLSGVDAGNTRALGLVIQGNPVDVIPAPNTMITVTPDVYVVLNEQIVTNGGAGIEVNLIHVYVGLPGNPLAELIISHAAAACGPVAPPCIPSVTWAAAAPPVDPCIECPPNQVFDCVPDCRSLGVDCQPPCTVADPKPCVCPGGVVECSPCSVDASLEDCIGDPCEPVDEVFTCDADGCQIIACEAYCNRLEALLPAAGVPRACSARLL